MRTADRWKHVRDLVNDGVELQINGGGYALNIASLCDETRQVCMFHCGGMDFDTIMDHLEELAKRYVEEGIVTDEVNGSEHCAW